MKKPLTAITAIAAGFVAGILMAPKSGKETREDIKKKAKEAKQSAKKHAGQAKLAAEDSAKSIKTGAQKMGEAASETARDVKDNVEKRFKQ